jgi:type II secretory pathway pseudopilin PulG
MRRTVSPLFATIVIIVALAIGALYFGMRYKKHEAEEAALSRALQAQADRARASGRAQRGMSRAMRQREEASGPRQGATVPGTSAAEERPQEPESAD